MTTTVWKLSIRYGSSDSIYPIKCVTPQIRKEIIAGKNMSVSARNVKIITLNGRVTLRGPVNFAETEQVAYCPSHVVPGIDFSNDPLLQGRLFSYQDTQRSRLGSPNFHQIPVNAPKCPFANQQRDGHMQMEQPTGRVAFEPNLCREHRLEGCQSSARQ